MEQRDRDTLTQNMRALVEMTGETELQELLSKLLHQRILSPAMAARYQGSPKDFRERARHFYIDIQGRGPNAFDALVDSLDAIGQWNLVKLLRPSDPLNNPQQYVSLKRNPPPNAQTPALLAPQQQKQTTTLDEDTERLRPITVVKSTVFSESPHPDITCYNMRSRNRGVLLMINNVQFQYNVEETRLGAKEDEANLSELFRQIGFHAIHVHNDKSAKEMEALFANYADDAMLRHTDCLFVVVASHGFTQNSKETYVRGHDGTMITTKKIIDCFNSENCVRLHNIPKVFIFQICRGDTPDYGYMSEKNQNVNTPTTSNNTVRTQMDGRSTNVTMRTYSDMLIVHSTVPGFQSHRDIKLGSWYFISMCEIFMEHCHNTHLDDLFILVDRHLKDIHLKRGSVQTSSIEKWGFNKYCYLNPGLFQ